MAIVKLTDGKYAGLSRDIKPSTAKVGASFYEYDTEDLYDKTLNNTINNGWKKRLIISESVASNTVKNKITVKIFQGAPFIVVMAGTDETNFEIGDLAIGIENSRFKALQVINTPVTSIADFSTGVSGKFS